MRDDPILIMGMHRSGTTLLVQMLDRLGVYCGHHREQHHEALACLEINDWILSLAHAAWDRPLGVLELLEQEPLVEAITEQMRARVRSRAFQVSFYGRTRWRRRSTPGPWGFKDPRTTVTWPFWRRVFPRARAVYVRRHGVDVAASLYRRARAALPTSKLPRFVGNERMARFVSVRCLVLERAYELWREVHELHAAHVARDPAMPICELLYEDLVSDPIPALERVSAFLDLRCPRDALRAATAEVNPERIFAYRADAELAAFAARIADDPLLKPWAVNQSRA